MNKYIKELEYDEQRRVYEKRNSYLNSFPNTIKSFFINKGISLNQFGDTIWAFNKINSIELIHLLKKENINIIGIDVVEFDINWSHTYNSLSLDDINCIDENHSKSINYIERFNEKSQYFIFVL